MGTSKSVARLSCLLLLSCFLAVNCENSESQSCFCKVSRIVLQAIALVLA